MTVGVTRVHGEPGRVWKTKMYYRKSLAFTVMRNKRRWKSFWTPFKISSGKSTRFIAIKENGDNLWRWRTDHLLNKIYKEPYYVLALYSYWTTKINKKGIILTSESLKYMIPSYLGKAKADQKVFTGFL